MLLLSRTALALAALLVQPSSSSAGTSEAPAAVSCFLRGGVDAAVTKCSGGGGFSTWVLDREARTWTDHTGFNCYPPAVRALCLAACARAG
jgi:hypothetical protein